MRLQTLTTSAVLAAGITGMAFFGGLCCRPIVPKAAKVEVIIDPFEETEGEETENKETETNGTGFVEPEDEKIEEMETERNEEVVKGSGSARDNIPDAFAEADAEGLIEEMVEIPVSISSEFLQKEEDSEFQSVEKDVLPLGTAGRWFIPSLDINVGMTWVDADDEYGAQAAVDAPDSAAFSLWEGSIYYLADHWTQGNFVNISKCRPGDTAYRKTAEGIIPYICTEATTGYNNVYHMVTDDGRYIENTGHEIVAYTCNGNWQNVWIAFFDKVPG